MGLSIDGNNIVFEGTVTVVNGFDATTGVAYLVLTPDGGYGTLPVMADGDPGPPPVLNMSMESVDPDDPLPDINPSVTVTDSGGPGVASHYDVVFYVHKGDMGEAGAFALLDATDIDGSPTDDYMITKKVGESKVRFTPQKVGGSYIGATTSTSGNSSPRMLSSVAIPAQLFDWRPRVFATATVSGTANTRVDLVARVGNNSTGHQVGFAKGLAGATPPPLVMIPAAPAGADIPGAYGRVAAGATTVVYLMAEQKAGTADAWATNADDTTFWVEVAPIPYSTPGS